MYACYHITERNFLATILSKICHKMILSTWELQKQCMDDDIKVSCSTDSKHTREFSSKLATVQQFLFSPYWRHSWSIVNASPWRVAGIILSMVVVAFCLTRYSSFPVVLAGPLHFSHRLSFTSWNLRITVTVTQQHSKNVILTRFHTTHFGHHCSTAASLIDTWKELIFLDS